MSHHAVYEALRETSLRPATWTVLMRLAYFHNKDTGRCDPSQTTLARDCNMSRTTLIAHLKVLETEGYIKRINRKGKAKGKPQSTFYVLIFLKRNSGTQNEQSDPNCRTDFVQNLNTRDSPETAHAPVQNLDTNKTREQKDNTPCIPRQSKSAVSLPANWVPSAKNIADAHALEFSDEEIHHEQNVFRDHHLAKGTRFKDWDAAWRNWLRNARKFQNRGLAGRAQTQSGGQGRSLASLAVQRRARAGL
jgi:DNA-binding transcriptional MocR family regulator